MLLLRRGPFSSLRPFVRGFFFSHDRPVFHKVRTLMNLPVMREE